MVRPEYWLRLNPWSLQALMTAVAGLAVAIVLRTVLARFGLPLYFGTFLPVIVVITLLAGVPAGAFTAVSTVVIVWWAYMPPAFQVVWPEPADIDRCQLFLLAVSVLIWFSHLCRTVAHLRRRTA